MAQIPADRTEFTQFANLCESLLGIRVRSMEICAHIITDGYTTAEDGTKYTKHKDSLARTITLNGEKIGNSTN